MTESFPFESDLTRRVRNLALGSTNPSNALIPLFEAVYNSIHSIQERFGNQWEEKGRIKIFSGEDDDNASFVITDNGSGLTEENFKSFRTYDSARKEKMGGRGVGRLTWLKVFEEIRVSSVFEENGNRFRRTFGFQLNNDKPIFDHKLDKNEVFDIGTEVHLKRMKDAYYAHCPTKPETIVQKLISHFISFISSESALNIVYSSAHESFEFREYLREKCKTISSTPLSALNTDFKVSHLAISRKLSDSSIKHRLFFEANGRIVREEDIALPLGLSTFLEIEGEKYVYTGVVSGDFLGEHVNSERNNFDLTLDNYNTIKDGAIQSAREALEKHIQRVVRQQADLVKGVLRKYPRYQYLVQDPQLFAVSLPRNLKTAEQVYQNLAIHDFRENRRIERAVDELVKISVDADEEINRKSKEIVDRLTAQEFSALADYTAKRKVIIDLLDRRLGYLPDGSMKRFAEDAIHTIVCPMRISSSDVAIDGHNLWIIDDKLTYYDFWASDLNIKKYISNSSSAARPDIALFNGKTAFHRPGTDQPIVIVEFKRPARGNYDYEENPIVQIYEYIEDLKDGKVVDALGHIIDEIPENKPFFCYVIADFTKNLKKFLKATKINVALPGGGGYYGFNEEYNAFIQVLNYQYVVKDARLRNEAFFKRLGI